jgi:colanic acid/amylovoran biosynthesis protein
MQLVVGEWFLKNSDTHVTVASVHSDHDKPLYTSRGLTSVRSARRGFLPLAFQLFAAVVLKPLPKKLQIALTRRSSELGAIIRSDLVIDLSGDMLTEAHGLRIGLSHFGPLISCRLLNRQFVILAQSIGPFYKLRRLATYLLRSAVWVTSREPVTSRFLKSEGVNFEQYPDLAFALPKEDTDGSSYRGKLGINLSPLTNSISLDTRGISLVDIYASALNSLDHEIVLIPHVYGPRPDQDDRTTLKELASKLTAKFTLIDEELSPNHLKGIISELDVFVGARMHSCIAALSQGIPTVAISYSHKSVGIMESLGLCENSIPISDATDTHLKALISKLKRDPKSNSIPETELKELRRLALWQLSVASSLIE